MRDWNLPIRDIIEQIGDETRLHHRQDRRRQNGNRSDKVLLALCDNLRCAKELTSRIGIRRFTS